MPDKGEAGSAVQFRRIFEAAPEPALVLDPGLTVAAVSDAFLHAAGVRSQDLLGHPLLPTLTHLLGPANQGAIAALEASFRRLLETRRPDALGVLKLVFAPTATRFWNAVNLPVLDDHGEILYIVHRAEDVTDLIQPAGAQQGARMGREARGVGEHLREIQRKLAKLERAKTRFLQNVSQEFCTPLSLLLGPIEQALQEASAAPREVGEEVREQLTLAYRNALRLLKMVTALIEFARIDAGWRQPHYQATDLAALTTELVANFRTPCQRAGLHLVVDCPPLPAPVQVDRGMWEKIVLNLISNACKYTRQGTVTVTQGIREGKVELAVADTGQGIPEHLLPHLFERFRPCDEGRSCGLGLPLVKALVRMHGGRIRAETSAQGSRFVVTLPFTRRHAPGLADVRDLPSVTLPALAPAYVTDAERGGGEPAGTLATAAATGRPRILVVDDSPDLRGYLSRLLSARYDVQSVADAEAALERLRQAPPDLLITELMLTGMDGYELLRRLRAHPATAAMPVIALSGALDEESLEETLRAGADDCLPKPFKARELLARVASQIAQSEHTRREHVLLQEVQAAKNRLDLVLESVSDAIVGIDREGRLAYLNSRAARRAGRSKEDLLGQHLGALFPGNDSALIGSHLERVLRDQAKARIEYFSESQASWFEARIFPAPGGAVIFSADISRRKQAELKLNEALARLRMAADMAGLGFWEWNLEDDSVYFSPEFNKQLGYGDSGLPNRIEEWKQRLHPDEQERVLRQVANYCQTPTPNFEIEYRMRHRDEAYRWIAARWMLMVHEGAPSRRLAVTHIDVTAKRAAEDQLRYVAGHDGLTGLPNRRLLYEFAEHMVASARRSHSRLAVLFFDLDEFKPVNDTYGHHVGDEVLREAALRIAQSLRAEDMVGRLGGDEFVAVLGKVEGDRDVTQAAIHTLNALRRPYRLEALELHVPASVGVSIFPDDGISIDTLIERADAAMYHAKNKHGDKLEFFTPEFQRELRDRSTVNERMKADLEGNGFQLVYQPMFACKSRRIVGLEAQLRWPGMNLTPAEFVPIAESNGQIFALGEWTLQEACHQLRDWRTRGLPSMPMEIKVSPLQFFHKDFCRQTEQTLAATGIAPKGIRLEVCEATMMRGGEEVKAVMADLQRLGVRVAIKEFGHGYSSLEQLSQLPIEALKINTVHFGPSLTETIRVLCRKLGFDLVACHVESEATLNLLRHQHYPKVQGYHLCRPMAGDELTAWYGNRVH